MVHKTGRGKLQLHHAYGLSGPRTEVLEEALRFIEVALKVPYRGNPDFYLIECDTLTIEESRRIKEIQSRRAISDHKAIIAAFNVATIEAQNALLKVLEEPVANTHIFLILPRLDLLLPTVRSRLVMSEYGRSASSETPEAVSQAMSFLKADVGQRLAVAKRIADDISDEKTDKSFVIELLNHIEQELWEKKEKKTDRRVFEEIALCRNYLSDRSSSVKMLLEHLALVLPPTTL